MKKFTELTLKDVVYRVKQDYTAKEKPQIETIPVIRIGVHEHKLQINEHRGYDRTYYLLNIPISEAETDIIRDTDQFITTNIEHVRKGVRETGLGIIKGYEKQIEMYQDLIKETRQKYFEYLN